MAPPEAVSILEVSKSDVTHVTALRIADVARNSAIARAQFKPTALIIESFREGTKKVYSMGRVDWGEWVVISFFTLRAMRDSELG